MVRACLRLNWLEPPDMIPTAFRLAIEASGLSQQAVARAFGVAPSTVRRWLSGALAVPQWVPLAMVGLEITRPLQGA